MLEIKATRLACLCALAAAGMLQVVHAADPAAFSPAVARSAVSGAAESIRLEEFFLLALSPSEAVAMLQRPDRRLVTLRVGTTLTPARARLVQVLGDRLRFDTVEGDGVLGTAWMIRSSNPEQLPQVQRANGIRSPVPTAVSTFTTTVKASSSSADSQKK
ncbi:MAG: hypothetical protein JF606_17370 [Burkholderiales bacterium]|nr:hypothetical protein [Burkholderiales bacterium]